MRYSAVLLNYVLKDFAVASMVIAAPLMHIVEQVAYPTVKLLCVQPLILAPMVNVVDQMELVGLIQHIVVQVV